MLKRLTIQNYALISSLDIEFPDGLVIITGETGAGKSILLGAISLLLGKKADSSVFNDATRNCVVEAEFGNEMILRRVISPTGRSRSFMNDEPVSLSELTDISNKIIDIHAQHQHLLLSDPDFQLSVLDYFSGSKTLLEQYKDAFRKHEAATAELHDLEEEIDMASSDAEYRTYQFKQLDEAKLRDGEMEELEEEEKRLSNAEEIRQSLEAAAALLNPFDTSIVQNLKEAATLIQKTSKFIPALDALSERLASAKIELGDIEAEINNNAEGIIVSPERLQQVDERLSQLYTLLKKHQCNNISELIQVRDALDSSLQASGDRSEKLETLKKEVAAADELRRKLASQLSAKRSKAAPALSKELCASIRELEMPHAGFEVALSPKAALTISGGDSLSFMFSANGASKLGDISRVASGGELSRVMLALKGLMARYTSLPTMIFDEIDTGVSGRIADKMGQMIGEMGQNMQIFAITHLPQIAGKKGAHFLVYKEFDANGEAQTKIRRLTRDERIMELARMLSGSSLTDAAVENAKVLLEEK